jgi:hypothetical protein
LNYGALGRVLISDNWAGYVVTATLPNQIWQRRQQGRVLNSNGVTDVKAQWTVPAVYCGKTDSSSAVWIGIDGETDGTVEQLGTGQDCTGGQPSYYAWFEIFPRPSQSTDQLTIRPGDTISAEAQYNGSGRFTLTLNNLTSGQSFTVTRVNLRALRQSAEWVVEAPAAANHQILLLAPFGTATFSNASVTIGGQMTSILSQAWPHGALIMENTDGTLRAYPSALNAAGSGFSVAWHAS